MPFTTLKAMASRLRYPELAPEGIAPLRTLEHYLNASTALPAVLLELVRLRSSLVNGCAFCIGHHTGELQKHNEPTTRIEALRDWASSDAFTLRERAALAWTDALTDIQSSGASDADYAAVSVYFNGKDLVDLTLAVASINAWNRLSMAFGATWHPNREQDRPGGPHTENAISVSKPVPAHLEDLPSPITPQGGRGDGTSQHRTHENEAQHDVTHDDGNKVAHD